MKETEIPEAMLQYWRKLTNEATHTKEGLVVVEPDDYKGSRSAYRLVTAKAHKDRRDQGTTARPAYIATIYSAPDATFFRTATEAVPALLDEVDRLRAQVSQLTKERDAWLDVSRRVAMERDTTEPCSCEEIVALRDEVERVWRLLREEVSRKRVTR